MARTTAEPKKSSTASRDLVVRALLGRARMTRAELARALDLAPSTITGAVQDLLAEGVVVDPAASLDHPKSGRRGRELTLNPRAGAVVGVDFGFRHVRLLLCDLAHNVLAARESELSESHTSQVALSETSRMLDEVLQEGRFSREEVLGAGVALPGPVRHDASDSVVRSAVLPGWTGATNESVGEALGARVRIDNDANLAALGEHTWGAAQGVDDCIVIKFHSGIGCGLVVGGRVVRGAFGGAGEIGHTTVDERGPLCRCGKRGCLDSFASVPAVLEALRPQHGDITLARALELLEGGDAGVLRVVTDAAQLVGKAIADACNLLAPERVVIVGALTQAGDRVIEPIKAVLERQVAPGQPPEVVLGHLGRRHTALGAVALALEESRHGFKR